MDKITSSKHAKLRGTIGTRPGLVRIDGAAVKVDERFYARLILRSFDATLSATDIAFCCRQRARLAGHETSARPAAHLSP